MKLKSGKIYIIPTRFGALFMVSITSILLAGAIYNNNLVNLLGFFLLAIALVAMVQTHNNLKNVRVQNASTEPGFADGEVTLTIALENSGNESRFNLEVRAPKRFKFGHEPDDIAPLQSLGVLRKKSSYAIPKRGRHSVTQVRVSTVYPVGLFWAWMWLDTDAAFIVYPIKKGAQTLPAQHLDGEQAVNKTPARGGDDFRGHRAYLPGDSGSRIDWKAFARGRPLLVKEFDDGNPNSLLLDWDDAPGGDIEAKLSQLALWIERAHVARQRFGLRLPNVTIAPNEGIKHYERCLEELALYPASGGSNANAG